MSRQVLKTNQRRRIHHDPAEWDKDADLVAVSKTPQHVSPAPSRRATSHASAHSSQTQRLCAVHRVERPVDELFRFVMGPDGSVVVDLKHGLPGRGVWVSADKASITKAVAQNVFARSLKQAVTVNPHLSEHIEELLLKRVLDTLSLANKAGAVVCGFTKTALAIDKGKLAVLLHGADGAADGCDKLTRKFRAAGQKPALARQIVAILTTAQLSLAIGRPNVVHAGLTEQGMARAFLKEARRLEHFGGQIGTNDTMSCDPIGND